MPTTSLRVEVLTSGPSVLTADRRARMPDRVPASAGTTAPAAA